MSPEVGFSTMSFPALRDERVRRAAGAAAAGGHAAGYAAGLQAAARAAERERAELARRSAEQLEAKTRELDEAIAVLRRAAAAFDARRAESADDARAVLLQCALTIAEAVVGCELRDGEASARSALARALAATDEAEAVGVRLHPDDLRLLEDSGTALAIPLIADDRLDRGDATVQLAEGWLDARLSTALERARRALEVEA